MRLFTFALAALSPLLSVITQQPKPAPIDQPEGYALRANAKLVVLDVIVTDKSGNPVTNLKKEDFEVQEDNRPQRLYSFESPAAHALPPNVMIHSTEELDRLAPNVSTNILVLDEYVSFFEYIYTARSAIQQYLKAEPKLLAQPTMLVAVNIDGMTVVQDYTQDRDAILASLDHHSAGAADRSGSMLRTGNFYIQSAIIAGYRTLEQLAKSTASHPGHKTIIWVGRGLPGIRTSADAAFDLQIKLQSLIDQLIASRVTLYTMDLGGVSQKAGTLTPLDNSDIQMATAAFATGGHVIHNRNDMDVAIATAIRDNSAAYTLSYIPPSDSDIRESLRKIRVVMKDPRLRATTRTGYYPNSEREPGWERRSVKPADKNALDKIQAILFSTTLVYGGIPVTLESTSTPGQVIAHVDSNALPWVDQGPNQPRTATVKISCVSFDAKGKILTHEGANTEVSAAAVAPGASSSASVRITLNYKVDPRAARLRVVIQSPTSDKVGATNLDLAAK